MTAIAGIVRPDATSIDTATVMRMRNTLTPYGQDAQHHWLSGSSALLRTLFRTTAEDRFDQQPLYHPESDTRLLFDGRLDNRDDLIRDLRLNANEARVMADSDLALRAVLEWDVDALTRFVGVFALAFWRAKAKRLWLARDPMGHRPLFWYHRPGFFAFASLPKALFAIPGIPRALCEERLADRLSLVPMVGPESYFKDVYRVEAGHVVTLEGDAVSSKRYHRFDPTREIRFPRDEDYVEAFQEKLDQAIRSQLRAVGKVASHLSSGFDSSTVTALAAKELGRRGERLTAYTSVPREGFSGRTLKGRHADETAGACALAAKFDNIDHVRVQSNHLSAIDELERKVEARDAPVVNPCQVWVEDIQRRAAEQGVRVLLTGQFGNMTLSYSGEQALAAWVREGRLAHWWQEARAYKRTHPQSRWRGILAKSFGPFMPAWLWYRLNELVGMRRQLDAYSSINPDFASRIGVAGRAKRGGWDLSYRPWANSRQMRIAVLGRIDVGDHMIAADQLGIDVRDPTADLRLIEFCLAVPEGQFLRNGETRWLLKRALGDILPPEIMNVRTKGYQAADWAEGVERDLPQIKQILEDLALHSDVSKYVDLHSLRASLDAWPGAEAAGASRTATRTYRLKLLRGLAIAEFVRYVNAEN